MAKLKNIPAFDVNGSLPEGVYHTDIATMQVRFVTEFPDSQTRPAIYEAFNALRADGEKLGVVGTQWVNGSFVTSKENPGDIDVVTFCDHGHLNNLGTDAMEFVSQYLGGGEAAKTRYRTHAFLVPSCSAGHVYFSAFETARLYWRKWFGRTRDIPNPPGPDRPGQPKGFLEMPLGNAEHAPLISHDIRSSP